MIETVGYLVLSIHIDRSGEPSQIEHCVVHRVCCKVPVGADAQRSWLTEHAARPHLFITYA